MNSEKTNKKIEWRKEDKQIYLPKGKPERIFIPTYSYFIISGKGNPGDPSFSEYIQPLYSLSYAIRMSYKNGTQPKDFFSYTVYPLEGFWDVGDKQAYLEGNWSKDDLVFDLMIRQPNFVDKTYAEAVIDRLRNEKPLKRLDDVRFETVDEGLCVQMMHVGSYDDEPASFEMMEVYCEENGLRRIEKTHKEVYISDPFRTAPEKLKTVLRFKVEER